MRRKRDAKGEFFPKPKPRPEKKKLEADVTKEIKFALEYIGLSDFVFKHWSGMGSRPGVPDLIGTLPPFGRAIFIEIKRPGGQATDDQAKFMTTMKRAGAVVGVVHSVAELRDILINAKFKPAHKLDNWKAE